MLFYQQKTIIFSHGIRLMLSRYMSAEIWSAFKVVKIYLWAAFAQTYLRKKVL